MASVSVTFECPEALLRALDDLADEDMCPRSVVIRRAIKAYLAAERAPARPPAGPLPFTMGAGAVVDHPFGEPERGARLATQ